jgi:signal transduction histidine kinase
VGPYVAVNAILIGIFGYAAIYHFVLWSQSRGQAVLLVFALHCVLCSAFSACLIALVTAHTPQQGQRALDFRLELSSLGQISSIWVLSLISGVRARRFVWFITSVFLTATIVNVAVLSLTGTVTGVEQSSTSWGEQVSILHREVPSRWLGVLYALAVAADVFRLVCVWRVWSRDRIGGALLAVVWLPMFVGLLRAALIDTTASQGLYLGALPYAVWALLFALQIARDYRLRGARLEESREQLHRLADGLLLAREEERTTIAREIHDVLGQALTALKMDVAWIGRRLPDDTPPTRAKLAEMTTLIDDAVVTVRRIATDLRPGVLDELGLAAAVDWQARQFEHRTGIHCALRTRVDDAALDPVVSTAVFRILQESLTNVARHSSASSVAVTLEHRDSDLVLEVFDNGIGIASAEASDVRSIGLAGMRERAQLVGGGFSITGAAGAGTTVLVQIPWRQEASA